MSAATFPYLYVPVTSWPPAPGGKLHTYLAGGTSAATTYAADGSTPNSNPVTLDANGTAIIKLDPAVTYHFVLKDSTDTTTIWDADNYTPIVFQTLSSAMLSYVQTAQEIAGSATIVNGYLAPGTVPRYGTNATPGTTDTTAAINSAVKQGIQNGGNLIFFPCVNGGSGVTANDYAVASGPVAIGGAVMFRGETDRLSFKGPRVNRTSNATGTAANGSLFGVTAAAAIAVTMESLGLTYTGGTALAGAALFYVNPAGAGPNSFYFRNVWFFEPMYYALSFSGCDDVQVLGCTFDVTFQKWFGIGGESAGLAENVSFVGNTFYLGQAQSAGFGELFNVDNFVFSNNRCYADSTHICPVGINASSSIAVSVNGLIVTGNTFEWINQCVTLSAAVTDVIISDNSMKGISGAPAISFTGGISCNNIIVSGNCISGYAPFPAGLIDATGTPLVNCVISHNSILCQNGASVATTATNASPCVFTGAIPSMANGMPVVLGGSTVPTGFTAGTTYFMVSVSGSTYQLSATFGGAAINSTSTGTAVTAAPMTAYGVNLSGSPNTGNTIGPNAISGYAISAYNVSAWSGNLASASQISVPLTLTGVSGTPAVAATFAVTGDMGSLQIPGTTGTPSGTAVSLGGLPAALWPSRTQIFPVLVTNGGTNVPGALTISSGGALTLNVGANGGAFANSGNQGTVNMTINYQL